MAASAAYDGLNRLKEFRRGTLGTVNEESDSNTADDKGRQKWILDAVGNWSGFKADATDGQAWDLDQTRLHNKANEIDNNDDHADAPAGSISGGNWVLPKQDACGNTIEGPKPGDETVKHKCVFDAWNRLVKVTDAADAAMWRGSGFKACPPGLWAGFKANGERHNGMDPEMPGRRPPPAAGTISARNASGGTRGQEPYR